MAKITIARGMTRLKTANSEIRDIIKTMQDYGAWNSQKKCFLTDTKKDLKTNQMECSKEVIRLYQKYNDLVKLITNIKVGIQQANLVTTMEIGGITMTIAEALVYQRNICDYMRSLGTSINYAIANATRDVESYNNPIMNNPNYDEGKRKELIADISYFFPYDEARKVSAFNTTFMAEINGTLNEINAITEIEIPD